MSPTALEISESNLTQSVSCASKAGLVGVLSISMIA